MQARTYTQVWRIERRLYKFYDINLPAPVTLRQLLVFATATALWVPVMLLIGVPFGNPYGLVAWVAPIIGATWAANRPLMDGKTPAQLVETLLRWWHRRVSGGPLLLGGQPSRLQPGAYRVYAAPRPEVQA